MKVKMFFRCQGNYDKQIFGNIICSNWFINSIKYTKMVFSSIRRDLPDMDLVFVCMNVV